MIYIILMIGTLYLLYFALNISPKCAATANIIKAAAFVLTAVLLLGNIVFREGMFDDLLKTETLYMYKAAGAVLFCLFISFAVAVFIKRSER